MEKHTTLAGSFYRCEDVDSRICENCKYLYLDKEQDTFCSELGWHVSLYDYEDTEKEYHGRTYISKDFGCNQYEKKEE